MAEAEPKVDISYTRPMTGITTATGLVVGPNTLVPQDVTVGSTFPGQYVVTVSGGVDQIHIQPIRGLQIAIDATASAKDVIIAPGAPGAIPPNTRTVTVPLGVYMVVEADGSGWWPAGAAALAGPTFTSALVRGVVDAAVANLAAFAVAGAGRDGITYVAGDIVLLMAQAAPAQNGPYVVGTVGGGNAPLTRPSWWAPGSTIPMGFEFRTGGEGTIYHDLVVYTGILVNTGVVDTDDPVTLFRRISCLFAANGTVAIASTQRGLAAPVAGGAGVYTFTQTVGVKFLRAAIKVSFATGAGGATLTQDATLTSDTQFVVATFIGGVGTNEGFYCEVTQ